MKLSVLQTVVVLTGLLLIVAGIIWVDVQLYQVVHLPPNLASPAGALKMNLNPSHLEIASEHPGIVMIALGVLLEMVALGASLRKPSHH
jgi:hypothetical protein